MATRSLIGMELDNGITRVIYCHWDGYPSGVGQTLVDHYKSPAAIAELMELGDLSVLRYQPYYCEAFNRDRNEPWGAVEPRDVNTSELDTIAKDYGVDYVYIYNNEYEWECYRLGYPERTLVPVNILADVA